MPLKPHIVRELAALERTSESDIETISRSGAAGVMSDFARRVLAADRFDLTSLVRLLKSIAVDLDQPAQIELIFDVIATLEMEHSSTRN